MFSRFHNRSNGLLDQTSESADRASRSGRRYANEALDQVSATLSDTRSRMRPVVDRVTTHAGDYARRSMDAMRDSSSRLREGAYRASDNTVGYIKDEPVKSILVAAAAGAALMALVSYLSRSRDRW